MGIDCIILRSNAISVSAFARVNRDEIFTERIKIPFAARDRLRNRMAFFQLISQRHVEHRMRIIFFLPQDGLAALNDGIGSRLCPPKSIECVLQGAGVRIGLGAWRANSMPAADCPCRAYNRPMARMARPPDLLTRLVKATEAVSCPSFA